MHTVLVPVQQKEKLFSWKYHCMLLLILRPIWRFTSRRGRQYGLF